MAMIPYMAAGYAVDRMMGGSGMTGLALGTGVGGFSTGAFSGLFGTAATDAAATSAAMTEAAGQSFPTLLQSSAGAGGSLGAAGSAFVPSTIANPLAGATPTVIGNYGAVNPLTSGLAAESISPFTPLGTQIGGATNIFGTGISNQAVNSALTGGKAFGGIFDSVPLDYLKTGTDFINEGWQDMSLVDKGSTLMMGSQAVDTMTAPPPMLQTPPPEVVKGKEPSIDRPVAINVQSPNRTYVDAQTFGLGTAPDIQVEDLLNTRRVRR